MSEELKPCPFCGGEVVVKAVNKNYGLAIRCQCSKCNARTEEYCPDTNKEDDTLENIEECKKRAIEAWNRRANDGKDDDWHHRGLGRAVEIVKRGGVC